MEAEANPIRPSSIIRCPRIPAVKALTVVSSRAERAARVLLAEGSTELLQLGNEAIPHKPEDPDRTPENRWEAIGSRGKGTKYNETEFFFMIYASLALFE